MISLVNNINMVWNSANVTSSTSRGSPLVDFKEWGGCLFCYLGSTLSGSSKIVAHVQGATANSTASLKTYAQVPFSSSTAYGAAASRNYKVLAVDVLNPPYRYNRVRINGSTGVGAEDNWLTIQHGCARRVGSTMVNQSTTVMGTTVVAGPTTY